MFIGPFNGIFKEVTENVYIIVLENVNEIKNNTQGILL